MWRIFLGVGVGLFALFINDNEKKDSKETKKKRLFISFAMEDEEYRGYLVDQAKNKRTPFTFIDMSVKKPWKQEEWKKKCRSKIKSCDGFIVLLSKNIWHSSGARWEIKCAKQEGIPIIGMHIKKNNQGAIPPELENEDIIYWSWENLSKHINEF